MTRPLPAKTNETLVCVAPERPEALIFDVDGTLADTEEAHRTAFNQAFESSGLPWRWSVPEYRELLKVTGGKERLAAFLNTLDLGIDERRSLESAIPRLHRTKTALYAELVDRGAVALREGVPELLDLAQSVGIRLAIATTTSAANVAALLRARLGPNGLDRFAVIGCGDQVPRKKPAPDVYLKVLNELGSSADNCVAFEDSTNGLTAAQTAGLFTVVTPSVWTQHEDLSGADLLLASLLEFKFEMLPAKLGARHDLTVR
jgi:HAD superfamily hydrolase (TIGR01509 family)